MLQAQTVAEDRQPEPCKYICTYLVPVSVSHYVFPAPDVAPLFLSVKAGMTVCVREIGADFSAAKQEADWVMGDVLFAEGRARDPKAPSLFQIADVDTGEVRWINADLVMHIVPTV